MLVELNDLVTGDAVFRHLGIWQLLVGLYGQEGGEIKVSGNKKVVSIPDFEPGCHLVFVL